MYTVVKLVREQRRATEVVAASSGSSPCEAADIDDILQSILEAWQHKDLRSACSLFFLFDRNRSKQPPNLTSSLLASNFATSNRNPRIPYQCIPPSTIPPSHCLHSGHIPGTEPS